MRVLLAQPNNAGTFTAEFAMGTATRRAALAHAHDEPTAVEATGRTREDAR